MNKRIFAVLAGTSLAATSWTATVIAQTADATKPAADDKLEEIVITGTLIRGIAPVGSNVIGVNAKKIEESGATTSGELLASLPQVGFFGTVPFGPSAIVGSNQSNSISRPNLRNLPAAQTSGGAQTLVSIDGHRVVGAGTQQVGVDPDIIAPGAIERVEALTDGGSALYGSDALGGVINFITRKRFDGVELTARKGFAKNVGSVDGGFTVGKDWGSGGAYLSYNYAHHDALYGADRDYIRRINYNTGVAVGRICPSPNITSAGATYVVSGTGLAAGGPNVCDQSDYTSLYPDSDTHNLFGRVNMDFTDSLSFDMTGMWATRQTKMNGGMLGSDNFRSATTSSVTVAATNPFYRPTAPGSTAAETVTFNYAPVFGNRSMPQRTTLDTLEIAPSLTYKLAGDWQIRGLTSYGKSKVDYKNVALNGAAQTAAFNAGLLNPYEIASSNPAALASVVGIDQGYGQNQLYDYRVIADGPVVDLPAGALKVAVGAEYTKDDLNRLTTNTGGTTPVLQIAPYAYFPVAGYTQTVKSAFAEATIPLLNDLPGARDLSLSVSGRYDKYNDFGDTKNPKIALSWKPINSLTIDANWGKSFNAPSPADQLGAQTALAQSPAPIGFVFIPPPPNTGAPFAANERAVILLNGDAPNLDPQTAKSWSLGATFKPDFLTGLTVHASYYNIDLKGTLGRPVGVDLTPFWTQYPQLYVVRPSGQQFASFLSDISADNTQFTLCNPNSTAQATIAVANTSCATAALPVGAAADTRVRNLGTTKLTGIDFNFNYQLETGFGGMDFGVAGNWRLKQDSKAISSAPVVHELDTNNPKLRMQTTVGTNIANFRTQVAWNHIDGYDRAGGASAANFGQDHIGSFETFDLFFKYDVNGEGLMSNLSFTLNVQNVADRDPPLVKSSDSTAAGFDPTLAFTLGRNFQLAAKKKF